MTLADVTEVGRLRSRVALLVLCVAVAIGAVLALPGIGEIRDRLAGADTTWVGVGALCVLASRLGFAVTLWAAFDRRLPLRRSIVLGFAEQGANVLLPSGGLGGPAFGALVMHRAGAPAWFAAERHAVLFLTTSLISFTGLITAGLLLAAGVLPGVDAPAGALVPALVALGLLALAVRVAARPVPVTEAVGVRGALRRLTTFVHSGAQTTLRLVREGDGGLLLGAIAYYALDVAALAAIFHAVGGPVPPLGVVVVAYTLGQMGALLPTPGGLGGTEGGLIGAFVAYGTPPELATAAVLGYRVFQLGLPALLGSVALARIQRRPETIVPVRDF